MGSKQSRTFIPIAQNSADPWKPLSSLGGVGGARPPPQDGEVGRYLGSKDPRRVKERVERHKEELFHSLTVETCQNISGLSEIVCHGRFFQETSKLYLPKWR